MSKQYCSENKSQELSCSRRPQSKPQNASHHRIAPPPASSPPEPGRTVRLPPASHRLPPLTACYGRSCRTLSPNDPPTTASASQCHRCIPHHQLQESSSLSLGFYLGYHKSTS